MELCALMGARSILEVVPGYMEGGLDDPRRYPGPWFSIAE